ncbi:MAG: hypothetical protein A2660_02080 [Candidatus Doudnabacteria bacterium RIFCSPHIGHO2_01_FULL_45_18]|uniref:Uncharacterized protein n=1 Tax=Candidatus Doudnabacteria bacterium RIFCSPHIGHO2_01_FULL_45_18 TaxID=1817823 RepID=A0A1F5NQ47_9BACT|nr:MAG: hypothetical protein A2660_02080 [Candidatus Doudnabacteria bacterium RIFCSPHIGHO2_01_FULL_45_18]
MPQQDSKNDFAKAVSLFLAEMLRTRSITLRRAADIAEQVINNINLIEGEADFLRLIKDLSRDFEELHQLSGRIQMNGRSRQRQDLEQQVREFVITTMSADLKLASDVLQAAVGQDLVLDNLCLQFPQFKQFVENR